MGMRSNLSSQSLLSNNAPPPEIRTLVDLLCFRAATTPARAAYIDLENGDVETSRVTYGELDRAARAIAGRWTGVGGERVLLLYHSGIEFVAAFFGALYAGAIPVPCYPPGRNRPDQRLPKVAADSGARAAMTSGAVLTHLDRQLKQFPALNDLAWISVGDVMTSPDTVWKAPTIAASSPAFLQYTSGSTSAPRGVVVTHANLMANLRDMGVNWSYDEASVMVTWLPVFHDMGLIFGILQPLYNGFACVMMPPAAFLQSPVRWLDAVTRYRGTHAAAPNFAYDVCARKVTEEQKRGMDLSSWRVALNAAEPVRAETMKRFIDAFSSCGFRPQAMTPGFGLAESTLKVTTNPEGALATVARVDSDALARHVIVEAPADSPAATSIVGCGFPVPETRVRIVDPERLVCVDEGIVGEVWVGGRVIAGGYWKRADETAAVFGARLREAGGVANAVDGPYLRTGDLGFLRGGELFITGRLKDMIIVNGLNHYPQDIELSVETSHPSLRPGCGAAFALEVDGEERVVVAQELDRAAVRSFDRDEIVGAIRRAVSEEHGLRLHAVLLLRTNGIPKTSSGKIQRGACRDRFLAGRLDAVAEWRDAESGSSSRSRAGEPGILAATELTERMRLWIADRFRISVTEVDASAPLAQYGVDSVSAVALSGELMKWLGRSISPTVAYDYPTIEAIARHLADGNASAGNSRVSNPAKPSDPIAVIGMACRFPGAPGLDAFWSLLENGVDAISEVPSSRWDANELHDADPDAEGKTITRHGGFLEAVDEFDAAFFGIAPREAESMDPQQRILLETAWEALEDAGIPAQRLAGSSAGVFVGISNSDYNRMLFEANAGSDSYAGTGNALSIAANRLSYLWDLRGPSLAIDTACSSSLVAIHTAIQNLRSGECEIAFAAGVNLVLSPEFSVVFSRARMLSPDGRCKTFDASADGYARGEGCGVVLLKRLSDAIRDGDPVRAVVLGSAVNQDGRSNGLTAPNGPSQQAVVREAIRRAGILPADVEYVEAHGTGTSLGDPIEVNALRDVLCEGRSKEAVCRIGSVKTNIGHLESAAGIAGFIKTVLSIEKGVIPRHLHLRTLNSHIRIDDQPIEIPVETASWQSPRRIAGVSSFGFGGTNAHVVLAAPPDTEARTEPSSLASALWISAKSERAVRAMAVRYAECLEERPDSFAKICASAAAGRSRFPHRLGVVAESAQETAMRLRELAVGHDGDGVLSGSVEPGDGNEVVFFYTGQGSQYPGMGRELYEAEPVFRAAFDRCDAILVSRLGVSLSGVLFGAAAAKVESAGSDARSDRPEPTIHNNIHIYEYSNVSDSAAVLEQTAITQPALFALEFALTELWRSWGVVPSAVIGHSVGEYAAAVAAGVMTLEDAAGLIAERGRLLQELPEGGIMVAIAASEVEVATAIAPYASELSIAAVNGAANIVISGRRAVAETVSAAFERRGVRCKALHVSHAFHSPLVEPILERFRSEAAKVRFSAPKIPFISNLYGGAADAEVATPGYWTRHIREPVRFASGISALEGAFLEIGPHPTLVTLAREAGRGRGWAASLRRGRSAATQMLEAATALFVCGIDVRPSRYQNESRINGLPSYPFERRRYWFPEGPVTQRSLGRSSRVREGRSHVYRVKWTDCPRVVQPKSLRPAELPQSLEATAAQHLSRPEFVRYPSVLVGLESLGAAWILRAFARMGGGFRAGECITASEVIRRHAIVPAFHRLVPRLLNVLVTAGILDTDGETWIVKRNADEGSAAELLSLLMRDHPEADAELSLLARTGSRLDEILRGNCDPLQLIFPEGGLSDVTRLYQDSPPARFMNDMVKESVRAAQDRAAPRSLRVLEIGAGTGSTTASLLPILSPGSEYVFTDVSPVFLAQAGERFRDYAGISFRLLDIERPPEEQGFEGERFDVVVASHVLHATRRLAETVRHARSLLAAGGLLILSESVAAPGWIDLIFGLTEGWWRFDDLELRISSPLLDRAAWRGLLLASGFDEVAELSPDGDVSPALAQYGVFAASANRPVEPGAWLIVGDCDGVGAALLDELQTRGIEAWTAAGADDLAKLLATTSVESVRGVVYLRALENSDSDDGDIIAEAVSASGEVAALTGVIVNHARGPAEALHPEARGTACRPWRGCRLPLWIVTRGAQARGDARHSLSQIPLWGLGQVVGLEYPGLRGGLLDLDLTVSEGVAARCIVDEILDSNGEDQILWKDGTRRVRRIESVAASAGATVALRPDATYLITGGLGAVGAAAAEILVRRGARWIALLGRAGANSPERADCVKRLESLGARVVVLTADLADESSLAAALDRIRTEMPALRGIVHAAGLGGIKAISDLTPEDFRAQYGAKIAGTLALERLTRGDDLEFFVGVSSMVATWGARGQGAYCAANSFLDGFPLAVPRAGCRTVTVGLGPVSGAGMLSSEIVEEMARMGVEAWSPERAAKALFEALRGTESSVIAAEIDWDRFKAVHETRGRRPLFANVGEFNPARMEAPRAEKPMPAAPLKRDILTAGMQVAPPPAGMPAIGGVSRAGPPAVHGADALMFTPALLDRVRAAKPEDRAEALLAEIASELAKVLRFESGLEIDPRKGFFDLGMDSLTALELRNRLEKGLGRKLPATLVFDHPNLEALTRFLQRQIADSASSVEVSSVLPHDRAPSASAPALNETSAIDGESIEEKLARLEKLVRA
jgi:acyl transferase domain-containing protein/acyl-CoA synthetase (AMP-forming)/AMP-acid ligase II/NAD(P)-dependent dehydrogenase (short-subunit alcohol dehydrogenase family)/acyl carrier protein/SAM-dependent methyltransferase